MFDKHVVHLTKRLFSLSVRMPFFSNFPQSVGVVLIDLLGDDKIRSLSFEWGRMSMIPLDLTEATAAADRDSLFFFFYKALGQTKYFRARGNQSGRESP